MIKSRRKWPVLLVCMLMTLVFGANIAVVVWQKGVEKQMPQEDEVLPRIEISLWEISLEELNAGSKEEKYPGNTVQVVDGGVIAEYSEVEIKGRGNSTWWQKKNPYQIKFDQKVDLFGMGKAKKWVLLANYFDDSNLRTDLAFYLEQLLGEPYALTGEFVELSIDGEDLGLYYLGPKVEIGKTRIDLRDPLGLLVEMDNLHKEEEHFSVEKNCLQVKDVVAKDSEALAVEIFADDLELLMAAARKKDLAAMAEVADLDSIVRYYLLSECTTNPDAYSSSFFMYKDGAEDKIHFGPGWDFDFSLGNKRWVWGPHEDFYSPYELSIAEYYGPDGKNEVPWLVNSEEFQELVGELYRGKLMSKREEVLDYLDNQAMRIWAVAVDDAEKWESDFAEELDYLREWVMRRFDFFDEIYGGMGELSDLRAEM